MIIVPSNVSAAPAPSELTATISVGTSPYAIAFNPSGTKAYVVNGTNPGTISVINTANNAVSTITGYTDYFGVTSRIAFTPDGTKAYATAPDWNRIHPINALTDTRQTYFESANPNPSSVCCMTDQATGLIGGYYTGKMYVFYTSNNSIGAGFDPTGTAKYENFSDLVSSPSGSIYAKSAWVTVDKTAGEVYSLGAYGGVGYTISVGNNPKSCALDGSGSKLYTANYGSNSVTVIDASSSIYSALSVIATVTVGTNPYGIGVTPGGGKVYVANSGSNTVSIIDTGSYTVEKTLSFPNGSSPRAVAVSPDGTKVYVVNNGNGTVSVIT